ncbi:coenzyme F420-0:L-glutamate ligase [Candidatus Bathyarchaeota archaeon]|nr:coenzyme F420-0:L-glutamate ligase [Candidatus Bathyarchaeota archaeon]
MRLKAIRIKTKYWRPGTDYVSEVVKAVEGVLQDGDIVTVSEKAISTAMGYIVDESKFSSGVAARFLVSFWTRRIWSGPLGKLAKLKDGTRGRLRNYPLGEGAVHKQVSLHYVGLLQSLRHYSEGGIDASNLPYSYVSLPLNKPEREAMRLFKELSQRNEVSVIIVDGDTTYSWRNLHLSPRIVPMKGLIHFGGFLAFLFGRMLGFKSRSTPIAHTGGSLNPDWALTLANIAHRVRRHGAGRTVWDMAEKLGVGLTEVTWRMLDRVDHYPIVILRREAS